VVLCLSAANILHKGKTVWNVMSIRVGQEWSELNSIQEVAMLVHANSSQTANKVEAAAGISHGSCHKNLMI
jgi:hypothetical protein